MIKAERYSILGTSLGVVLLAIGIFWGPRLVPYSPDSIDFTNMGGVAPGGNHWCGVDVIGQDVCARVLAGANLQARLTAMALGIAAGFGGVLGLVAGVSPAWVRA